MPTPRSLLALAVLAGATCLPLTATAQGEDPRMASIQTLKEQAAEIRGLAWKRDVNVEWRSSSSLREYFEGAFDKEISPEEVTLAQATLRHLGMIPTDKDLKTLYLDMVEEGVAGFYDPSNETLWIIEQENALTGAAADANNDMVVIHELVHALEDQHYDFEARDKAHQGNDDRAMGFQGLVEGSATYAMMQPMIGQAGGADPEAQVMMLKGMAWLMDVSGDLQAGGADTPTFLMRSMLYPYVEGLKLTSEAAKEGGYDAINKLYDNPPVSTEQVLHPEKLLGEDRDDPIEHTLPDLGSTLGEGWTRLGGTTMGELQMRLLFQDWLLDRPAGRFIEDAPAGAKALIKTALKFGSRLVPQIDPIRAADGWGGDHYQTLRNKDGDTAIVWWTAWDTTSDATEFVKAYRRGHKNRGLDASELVIEREANAVWILEGVPRASRAAVLEAISE